MGVGPSLCAARRLLDGVAAHWRHRRLRHPRRHSAGAVGGARRFLSPRPPRRAAPLFGSHTHLRRRGRGRAHACGICRRDEGRVIDGSLHDGSGRCEAPYDGRRWCALQHDSIGQRIRQIERERKNRKKNDAATKINTMLRGFLAFSPNYP